MTATTERSTRRGHWIPWVFIGLFGVVLAANGTMIVIALATWTGLETTDAYHKGLTYNRTLGAAEAQAALGWQVDFSFTQTGTQRGLIEVGLADGNGHLIKDAAVRAELVRPTHDGHDLTVDLSYQRGGRYRQEVDLPLAGQWDVRITAIERGQPYRLSERIYVAP